MLSNNELFNSEHIGKDGLYNSTHKSRHSGEYGDYISHNNGLGGHLKNTANLFDDSNDIDRKLTKLAKMYLKKHR